jgi:hypothetical protein
MRNRPGSRRSGRIWKRRLEKSRRWRGIRFRPPPREKTRNRTGGGNCTGRARRHVQILPARGNSFPATAGRNITLGLALARFGNSANARWRKRRIIPPPPFPAERYCSVGLEVVLVLAKLTENERRKLLCAGFEERRRAFTPKTPPLPKPARELAIDYGVGVARDAMFVAAGLRGAPPEVIDQRLAQVPDPDFREAVLALMASG